MGKQDYVGQYFINNVDQSGSSMQDVGECIWQDSENLLCALHAEDSCSQAFCGFLLIPVRLAKKIKWYAVFDDFENAISDDSNSQLEISMNSEERDALRSIRVPGYYMEISEILWGGEYNHAGLCVATLVWSLKERPDAGEFLAMYIADRAPTHKDRKATIEVIAKVIADAGLSTDEIARLGRVHQEYDQIPF